VKIIAQALVEDCAVLTTDARFTEYGVSVLG
jgi:PIN domain nuclease of toxin-antitoxin system